MDTRKLRQSEEIEDYLTMEEAVNSKKVNEALINAADEMFGLEHLIKQKAQLKYLETKSKKRSTRSTMLKMLSHEYLWTPTPVYYFATMAIFVFAKRRYRLKPYIIIPFLALPVTMDFLSKHLIG